MTQEVNATISVLVYFSCNNKLVAPELVVFEMTCADGI